MAGKSRIGSALGGLRKSFGSPEKGSEDSTLSNLAVSSGSVPSAQLPLVAAAQPQAYAPTLDIWICYASPDGMPYFHNARAGETVWELPAGAIAVNPDGSPVAPYAGEGGSSSSKSKERSDPSMSGLDVIATRTSDDSAVGHLVQASRSSSKARETRSMLVEFTDDWRADAKSKLNDFISQNVLSEDAWDMTICDKNGQRLPGPPNAGVIEPFPISFVFTRKDVETVNQSAEETEQTKKENERVLLEADAAAQALEAERLQREAQQAEEAEAEASNTRSMLVEYKDDWRKTAKSTLNEFIRKNELSDQQWDMAIRDKNGLKLPGPPDQGITEPFPISFVFTRIQVVNEAVSKADVVATNLPVSHPQDDQRKIAGARDSIADHKEKARTRDDQKRLESATDNSPAAAAQASDEQRLQREVRQAQKAQAAAEATAQAAAQALQQERLHHEQSVQQHELEQQRLQHELVHGRHEQERLQQERLQQEWNIEREALQAEVRRALEAQEAAKQVVPAPVDKEALREEVRKALEAQEATQAEAQLLEQDALRSEMRELLEEQKKQAQEQVARSELEDQLRLALQRRQIEDEVVPQHVDEAALLAFAEAQKQLWQSEQDDLKAEMRQLLQQQQQQAQDQADRSELEEQLRLALDEQRQQIETDRENMRSEWQAQQEQLKSEVLAAHEAQKAEAAQVLAAKENQQLELAEVRRQLEVRGPEKAPLEVEVGAAQEVQKAEAAKFLAAKEDQQLELGEFRRQLEVRGADPLAVEVSGSLEELGLGETPPGSPSQPCQMQESPVHVLAQQSSALQEVATPLRAVSKSTIQLDKDSDLCQKFIGSSADEDSEQPRQPKREAPVSSSPGSRPPVITTSGSQSCEPEPDQPPDMPSISRSLEPEPDSMVAQAANTKLDLSKPVSVGEVEPARDSMVAQTANTKLDLSKPVSVGAVEPERDPALAQTVKANLDLAESVSVGVLVPGPEPDSAVGRTASAKLDLAKSVSVGAVVPDSEAKEVRQQQDMSPFLEEVRQQQLASVAQQQLASSALQKMMQEQLKEVAESCQEAVRVAQDTAAKAISEVKEPQKLLQDQLKEVAESCQEAVRLAQDNASKAITEAKDTVESSEDWSMKQKLLMQEAMEQMESHQDAMQQRVVSEVQEANRLHAESLQEVNELLARQHSGNHDKEVAQKQMQDELRESLEAQRVMFQEAAQRQEQAAELAAQRQVKEAVESKTIARREFEAEVRRALEEKQRQAMEANQTLAAALQKQVADTFAPLSQHLEDVDLRQEEDNERSKAREEKARKDLEVEVHRVQEAEKRTREMQQRTEAAVQEQLGKAMELFKDQVQEVERARADDAERVKRSDVERRAKLEEDREVQNRAERQNRWRLEELEEKQSRSQDDASRLEEALRKARDGELERKDAEVRRQMEWQAEKREMQWKAEAREMEWKSEVRQMEWQMDWQTARFVEESELLRPPEPALSSRVRSESRVRERLSHAVVAAGGEAMGVAPAVSSRPSGGGPRRSERPHSAGAIRPRRFKDKWEEAEDAIEKLVGYAVPGGFQIGGGAPGQRSLRPQSAPSAKQRSSRPVSAGRSRSSARPGTTSRRSLAEEVAADLDGMPAFDQPSDGLSTTDSTGDDYNAAPVKRVDMARVQAQPGKLRSASIGASYQQVASHSKTWFDLQRAKKRDNKVGGREPWLAGGRGDTAMPNPVSVSLDEVCRAYPEVSQILKVG